MRRRKQRLEGCGGRPRDTEDSPGNAGTRGTDALSGASGGTSPAHAFIWNFWPRKNTLTWPLASGLSPPLSSHAIKSPAPGGHLAKQPLPSSLLLLLHLSPQLLAGHGPRERGGSQAPQAVSRWAWSWSGGRERYRANSCPSCRKPVRCCGAGAQGTGRAAEPRF